MKHLPLFFDLNGRKVVVVGEGPAADRRAALARSAGAGVRQVVEVRPSDLRGAVAAFVATSDLDRDTAAQRVAKSVGVPVNVLAIPGGPSVAELNSAGVRRVSTGASLAHAAYGAAMVGARELLEAGTSTYAATGVSRRDLAAAF